MANNANWENSNLNNGWILAHIKCTNTMAKNVIERYPEVFANCPEKARLEALRVKFTPKLSALFKRIRNLIWFRVPGQHKIFIHLYLYIQAKRMALLIPDAWASELFNLIEPSLKEQLIDLGLDANVPANFELPTKNFELPTLIDENTLPIVKVVMVELIKLFKDVYGTEDNSKIEFVFTYFDRSLPDSLGFFVLGYLTLDPTVLAAHTNEILDDPAVQRMIGIVLTRMRRYATGNNNLIQQCNLLAAMIGAEEDVVADDDDEASAALVEDEISEEVPRSVDDEANNLPWEDSRDGDSVHEQHAAARPGAIPDHVRVPGAAGLGAVPGVNTGNDGDNNSNNNSVGTDDDIRSSGDGGWGGVSTMTSPSSLASENDDDNDNENVGDRNVNGRGVDGDSDEGVHGQSQQTSTETNDNIEQLDGDAERDRNEEPVENTEIQRQLENLRTRLLERTHERNEFQRAFLEVQESSLVIQEGERHFFDVEISNLRNAHRAESLQALDAINERDESLAVQVVERQNFEEEFSDLQNTLRVERLQARGQLFNQIHQADGVRHQLEHQLTTIQDRHWNLVMTTEKLRQLLEAEETGRQTDHDRLEQSLRDEQNNHRIEQEAAGLERNNLRRQAQEQRENHEHVQQDLHHSQNIVDNVRRHAQEQQANLEGVQQDLHDAEERVGNLTESLRNERNDRRIEQEEARLERNGRRDDRVQADATQNHLGEELLNERNGRNDDRVQADATQNHFEGELLNERIGRHDDSVQADITQNHLEGELTKFYKLANLLGIFFGVAASVCALLFCIGINTWMHDETSYVPAASLTIKPFCAKPYDFAFESKIAQCSFEEDYSKSGQALTTSITAPEPRPTTGPVEAEVNPGPRTGLISQTGVAAQAGPNPQTGTIAQTGLISQTGVSAQTSTILETGLIQETGLNPTESAVESEELRLQDDENDSAQPSKRKSATKSKLVADEPARRAQMKRFEATKAKKEERERLAAAAAAAQTASSPTTIGNLSALVTDSIPPTKTKTTEDPTSSSSTSPSAIPRIGAAKAKEEEKEEGGTGRADRTGRTRGGGGTGGGGGEG